MNDDSQIPLSPLTPGASAVPAAADPKRSRRRSRFVSAVAIAGAAGLVATGTMLVLDLTDNSADHVAFAANSASGSHGANAATAGTAPSPPSASPSYDEALAAALWAVKQDGKSLPAAFSYTTVGSEPTLPPAPSDAAAGEAGSVQTREDAAPGAGCTVTDETGTKTVECGEPPAGAQVHSNTPNGSGSADPNSTPDPSGSAGAPFTYSFSGATDGPSGSDEGAVSTYTFSVFGPDSLPEGVTATKSKLAEAMLTAQRESGCGGVVSGVIAASDGTAPRIQLQCPNGTSRLATLGADYSIQELKAQ